MDALSAFNTAARIKNPDANGRKEPELYHRNMEMVRAHNQLNDRFGQPRQHPLHQDLKPDTGEVFVLTYYNRLQAECAQCATKRTAPDTVSPSQQLEDPAAQTQIEAKRTKVSSTLTVAPECDGRMVALSDVSCMDVAPSTLGPTTESIALFGAPTEYPRVDLEQPTLNRPFEVMLPDEPSEVEKAAIRHAERKTLEALPEEEQRELFGVAADAPLPHFYNKHKNQCAPECYEAHKIDKGGGKFRRGRSHYPWCPQFQALQANTKLKH